MKEENGTKGLAQHPTKPTVLLRLYGL